MHPGGRDKDLGRPGPANDLQAFRAFKHLCLVVKGPAAEEQIDIGLLVEVVQHVHIIAEHSGLRIHRNAGRQLLRGGTIVDDDELSGLDNLGRIFPDTPLF